MDAMRFLMEVKCRSTFARDFGAWYCAVTACLVCESVVISVAVTDALSCLESNGCLLGSFC